MRAKITFSTNGKSYEYEFPKPIDNSIEALAFSIASAKHKFEHKTKFSGVPDSYELILGMLRNKNIAFSGEPHQHDYFRDATQRNAQEKYTFNETTGKYEVVRWRVGYTFSNHLGIDLDGKNKDNLFKVLKGYEHVLQTKFTVIESNSGYWLISEIEFGTKEAFVFANLQVLNPDIHYDSMEEYKNKLLSMDYDKNGRFKKSSTKDLLKLCNPIGEIDILFNLLSIKREQSTLRISKKHKDDNIKVIT